MNLLLLIPIGLVVISVILRIWAFKIERYFWEKAASDEILIIKSHKFY